jgi:hypothetical protein
MEELRKRLKWKFHFLLFLLSCSSSSSIYASVCVCDHLYAEINEAKEEEEVEAEK